ncbi:hypothetical protein PT974_09310 [Cladobotryum mycophilum]|uniref:Transcriptional activator n=1 Tax=Cladobotryum mycophilum TaxID=491253 RepID=A0ABR0SFU0_9HYPO
MNSTTGRAGVIRARDDAGSMDKLAHSVLDDVLYNILSDILMKTHREEKTARATTAAIKVEKLASESSDSSTPDSRPDVRIETDAAIYDDGKVLLKGNPLKTTQDIICPRCHLPRLLYPTDGKGSRKPESGLNYCKRHPYIEKPGCDIYGQSWVGPGPGRGKKKKDMDKKDGNADSGPEQRPPNVLSFPSATCSKCKRCILVTRLNNHMGSCIGNSGRNASRAAAQRMNGGSQHEPTPPPSSKATPTSGSRGASPKKREASDDDDDSENSTTTHKKKKMKHSLTKKVIIKTKPLKKEKLKGSSLSQETKAGYSDGSLSADKVLSKVKNKSESPLKKLKGSKPPMSSPRSKHGRDVDGESESSGTLSSPPATHH